MDVAISSMFPYTIDGKTTDGCIMSGIMYVSKAMFEELKTTDDIGAVLGKYNVIMLPASLALRNYDFMPKAEPLQYDDSSRFVYLGGKYGTK